MRARTNRFMFSVLDGNITSPESVPTGFGCHFFKSSREKELPNVAKEVCVGGVKPQAPERKPRTSVSSTIMRGAIV
jgi:hypothetical protein